MPYVSAPHARDKNGEDTNNTTSVKAARDKNLLLRKLLVDRKLVFVFSIFFHPLYFVGSVQKLYLIKATLQMKRNLTYYNNQNKAGFALKMVGKLE
jgi:hypothetical protein